MLDDFTTKPTDMVGPPGNDRKSEARVRWERRVAAEVVMAHFSVSQVAEKFGITPEEVREIFQRRCPNAPSDAARRIWQ